jgi:hypothetical protein
MLNMKVGKEQELLEVAWNLLIRRDQLLGLVNRLPSPDREQMVQIIGDLKTYADELRALADDLTSCANPDDPEERRLDPDELHERLDALMEGIRLTGQALYDIAGPAPQRETEPAN